MKNLLLTKQITGTCNDGYYLSFMSLSPADPGGYQNSTDENVEGESAGPQALSWLEGHRASQFWSYIPWRIVLEVLLSVQFNTSSHVYLTEDD